jgi:hypothetical protein
MYRLILITFLVIGWGRIMAQSDSVAYSKNFVLYEGLYITFSDLKHNWPIPKEKISTKIEKNQLDFYSQLIESENIEYIERDGAPAKLNSAKAWGFCQNNVVYININKTFFRIPLFGAISYFVASVPVNVQTPGYNIFINSSGGTGSNNITEMREFLLDFYTGTLTEFSFEALEELLKKDATIHKEYSALSKKKKKEMTSRYIRMFNEKHPIYFPKN